MELGKQKSKDLRRKSSLDLGTMVYGKIPPQARDLEMAVLGAIMLQRDAYDDAAALLKPEMFYVEGHQHVYRTFQALAKNSQPIDSLTVEEQLRKDEKLEVIGGPYYLHKLTNTVVSAAHMTAHARIIIDKFIQRELIRIAGEIIQDAYEDSTDPRQLFEEAQQKIGTIGESMAYGDMVEIGTVLVDAINKIQEWSQQETSITGVPSGYPNIDRATRGWQGGDLIIIAARPSVGKTAFALNLIRNAAKTHAVAVWSLEMKALMLVLRMMAAESGELLSKLQTGRLSPESMRSLFEGAVRRLAALNIFFDDTSSVTLAKLSTKARKLKRKGKLGLIVVDYLQLMTLDERAGNREQEISRISRGLKNLAQELNVPVIALSQLSREVEKRAGGKPQLSDLRESGSIEQDADVVMFLWGPSDSEIEQDHSLLTRRYVRIAKQRNGTLLTEDLEFKDEIQLFNAVEKSVETTGMGSNWKPISSVRNVVDITTSSRMSDSDDAPF